MLKVAHEAPTFEALAAAARRLGKVHRKAKRTWSWHLTPEGLSYCGSARRITVHLVNGRTSWPRMYCKNWAHESCALFHGDRLVEAAELAFLIPGHFAFVPVDGEPLSVVRRRLRVRRTYQRQKTGASPSGFIIQRGDGLHVFSTSPHGLEGEVQMRRKTLMRRFAEAVLFPGVVRVDRFGSMRGQDHRDQHDDDHEPEWFTLPVYSPPVLERTMGLAADEVEKRTGHRLTPPTSRADDREGAWQMPETISPAEWCEVLSRSRDQAVREHKERRRTLGEQGAGQDEATGNLAFLPLHGMAEGTEPSGSSIKGEVLKGETLGRAAEGGAGT